MLKKVDYRKKLQPLYRFTIPGVYSPGYLSILVNRKKLKAKRIGRNFYTTEEWFDKYIELHSQGKKRVAYQEYIREKKKRYAKLNKNLRTSRELTLSEILSLEAQIRKNKVNFFISRFLLNPKFIAATAVIFLLFAVNVLYLSLLRDKGEVAGESEIATSSEEQIIIKDNEEEARFE